MEQHWLSTRLLQKGLGFSDVALAVGESEMWVIEFIHGEHKPSLRHLDGLSRLLGMSENHLLARIGDRLSGTMAPQQEQG